MVLNTEWTQLETIELLCEAATGTNPASPRTAPTNTQTDKSRLSISVGGLTTSPSGSSLSGGGGGFGFGITGNKSTGVVVKAITPGGYAQKVGLIYAYLETLKHRKLFFHQLTFVFIR